MGTLAVPAGSGSTEAISAEVLKQYLHLPAKEVAKRLGLCLTSLKKGMTRWPYRKLRSIEKKLESLKSSAEEQAEGGGGEREEVERQIRALKCERDALPTSYGTRVAASPSAVALVVPPSPTIDSDALPASPFSSTSSTAPDPLPSSSPNRIFSTDPTSPPPDYRTDTPPAFSGTSLCAEPMPMPMAACHGPSQGEGRAPVAWRATRLPAPGTPPVSAPLVRRGLDQELGMKSDMEMEPEGGTRGKCDGKGAEGEGYQETDDDMIAALVGCATEKALHTHAEGKSVGGAGGKRGELLVVAPEGRGEGGMSDADIAAALAGCVGEGGGGMDEFGEAGEDVFEGGGAMGHQEMGVGEEWCDIRGGEQGAFGDESVGDLALLYGDDEGGTA